MNLDKNLESIIRQYVKLTPPNAKGWEACVHIGGCDHGRKGPRAAFLFEGDCVSFHCFNCGKKPQFNPERDERISDGMIKILMDFGIPKEEWQQAQLSALLKHNKPTVNLEEPKIVKIEPDILDVPNHFYFLKDATPEDKWAIIANDYLEYERGVNPSDYPFMLSSAESGRNAEKWKGRLIIPVYKNKRLIFWMGRALGKRQRKYLHPGISKDRILYGFNELFKHSDLPLYIVEGWFDAFAIDGIALLGNNISEAQTIWLNRSRRQKIYIPDRFGDGKRAARQALKLGWKISIPDTPNCKDMNDAVKKYGKLYTLQAINRNTCEGFEAEVKLKLY